MGVEGVVIRTCPLSCGDVVLEEGEEVSIVVVSCIVSIGDDIVFSVVLDGEQSLLVRGGEGGGVSILMLLFDMVLKSLGDLYLLCYQSFL